VVQGGGIQRVGDRAIADREITPQDKDPEIVLFCVDEEGRRYAHAASIS
jgi:hypothetical protein